MNTRDRRKISEMRNLGPVCERDLNAVGIMDAEDVIRLEAETIFIKMLDGRLNRGISAKCCNAAYLYAIYGAIHDIDWRKIPESRKSSFKKFAAELRRSGRYG